jgi:predicted O-methyltransferase YrrM
LEHDKVWHQKVKAMLDESGIRNVDYRCLLEPDYVETIASLQSASLDYALIDGIERGLCALYTLDKLRPSGILIVDNANWFIPARTHSPSSVTAPADPTWKRIIEQTSTWRRIWTSNGVTDTAIWIKP